MWIIVLFYQLLGLSFWRYPLTAEDTFVSNWCNATFLQICSHGKKLLYIMDGLRVRTFSAHFHFWTNYYFHSQPGVEPYTVEMNCCHKIKKYNTIESSRSVQAVTNLLMTFTISPYCAAFPQAGNSLCSRHLRVCAWIYTVHSISPSYTFLLLLASKTIISYHP